MKRLKILAVVCCIAAFICCILDYWDNLNNSAYLDPHGPVKHLQWFQVCIPIFAFAAMYCIITINKESDAP